MELVSGDQLDQQKARPQTGRHLEEFDFGWFIRQDWMSEKSVSGGSFCVVERATGGLRSLATWCARTTYLTASAPGRAHRSAGRSAARANNVKHHHRTRRDQAVYRERDQKGSPT